MHVDVVMSRVLAKPVLMPQASNCAVDTTRALHAEPPGVSSLADRESGYGRAGGAARAASEMLSDDSSNSLMFTPI
ncbi:hypothetical protein PoB_002011700 [Plakobranchus ocellatus]|uniref:Uncharacterized protein n=1 Tax=Plakobranchus ocellatus TaxID=259542 RepID=A0AAV3ZGK2_9GAST|nr:hypothetical protein PoB_002011700 [Plakobranchus ocellatus]